MADISLDDFPQHTPGQPPLPARPPICLGQEVLNHGRTPRLPLPTQGTRTVCLSGIDRAGGVQLRGPPMGRLRPVLSPRGSRAEKSGLVYTQRPPLQRGLHGPCQKVLLFACRKIICPRPALGTQTAAGSGGSKTQTSQDRRPQVTCPPQYPIVACGSTTGGASRRPRHAATPTSAHTPTSNAPAEASGEVDPAQDPCQPTTAARPSAPH